MMGSASLTIFSCDRGVSYTSSRPAAIRQRRQPAPQMSSFDGLRDGERHLRSEAEGGSDKDIGPLLHTHSVRNRERDGADGIKQALYNEHGQKAERCAGQAKDNPDLDGARYPAR